MRTIKEFQELLSPQQETVGNHKGKWFVFAVSAQAALIAKGDSYAELGDASNLPINPPSDFFFNSYDDAFDAAILYYIPFGKRYPYTRGSDEYLPDGNDVESQAMEFL